MALDGHLHYQTGEHRKAQEGYERTLDLVVDASDTHPIYLHLGSIYLEEARGRWAGSHTHRNQSHGLGTSLGGRLGTIIVLLKPICLYLSICSMRRLKGHISVPA